jgi:ABC-type nickel/cobalt efflux system permease component RcnA
LEDEKERHENIRRMAGKSIDFLGNIGGLLAGIVAFIILVGGYVLIVEKKPIRSDYVFYFSIVNVALLTGIGIAWYYRNVREINIQ